MEDMTDDAKALAWTLFHIEELIDKGLVDGPKLLNPAKRHEVQALVDSGYRPTDEQIHDWMANLVSGKVTSYLDQISKER